jgi:hypothetical protein
MINTTHNNIGNCSFFFSKNNIVEVDWFKQRKKKKKGKGQMISMRKERGKMQICRKEEKVIGMISCKASFIVVL